MEIPAEKHQAHQSVSDNKDLLITGQAHAGSCPSAIAGNLRYEMLAGLKSVPVLSLAKPWLQIPHLYFRAALWTRERKVQSTLWLCRVFAFCVHPPQPPQTQSAH